LQEGAINQDYRIDRRDPELLSHWPISFKVDDPASVATVAAGPERRQNPADEAREVIGILVVPSGGEATTSVTVHARMVKVVHAEVNRRTSHFLDGGVDLPGERGFTSGGDAVNRHPQRVAPHVAS
jgi:hypothetical protein